MVKVEYIIVAVVAVLLLAGVGYVAYDQGLLKGTLGGTQANTTSPDTTVSGDDEAIISQPVSALTALSSIEGNSKFTDWKSGKKTVYATDISSEDCANGLSTTWTFTYVSDDEQAIVIYDSGRIANILTTPLQTDVKNIPALALNGVIDSDKADSLAAANATASGKSITGTASAELSTGAQNTSNWDVIYRVTDGYYRVRLNSVSGSVVETKSYSMG